MWTEIGSLPYNPLRRTQYCPVEIPPYPMALHGLLLASTSRPPPHLHNFYTLHTLAFFWSACACFSLGLKKMFCADSMARMVRISSLHPRSTLAINT